MKKTTMISSLCLATLSLAGGLSALAADPAVATTEANVVLESGDDTSGGNTDPGGGGGEVVDPGPDPGPGGGGIVNPGQTTSLKLGLMTMFNFGDIKMSGNTMSYHALLPKVTLVEGNKEEERPNFVQVIDNRGTNAGWHLTAKILEQFTNGTTPLTGATIALNNGWSSPQSADLATYAPEVSEGAVLTTVDDTMIANATVDNGMGTWSMLYGALDEADFATKGDARKSVVLEIPGLVKKDPGAYKAKIQWTLNDTPKS